ncbi:decaprenyl-phosphate phosphoribosyltransferase [Marinomonas fungiae]|uniref:4-hydroxybenzoate polyprenyltransferase n=1 Tax=Marinomonas fungiae TaxID=1137284 RepID=A0A0K6IHH7_9GAMM|nr:decaprenyl-phosphate phosphoribosyltransferase [Marinomonas fungiae]CUB02777.1 4-hydroxybenzoate polyprenyltransferase [Marinomonas fungiae]
MWVWLRLLRIHQYIKNSFVLIGVIFAGAWEGAYLVDAVVVFWAFCFAASAVYIMNDIFDIEADRLHPTKSKRPIPSGLVSLPVAWGSFTALLLMSFALSLLWAPIAALLIAAYVVLNVLYTLYLKKVAILDVFIISSGFMLRILAGTVGIGIAPSSWLLLCGLMLTLFLGFCKRRAELLMLENDEMLKQPMTREVLGSYSPIVIEQFMAISASATILSYSLYTMSEETIARHQSEGLIYTVPFVVYGIFRYILLLHKRGKGTDTAKDLYTDSHMLVAVAAWLLTILVIVI